MRTYKPWTEEQREARRQLWTPSKRKRQGQRVRAKRELLALSNGMTLAESMRQVAYGRWRKLPESAPVGGPLSRKNGNDR